MGEITETKKYLAHPLVAFVWFVALILSLGLFGLLMILPGLPFYQGTMAAVLFLTIFISSIAGMQRGWGPTIPCGFIGLFLWAVIPEFHFGIDFQQDLNRVGIPVLVFMGSALVGLTGEILSGKNRTNTAGESQAVQ